MTGAAGGNVAASSGAFMQAAAVNYLQGLGASGVKQIADQLGQGPQAEAARAALHSIVGCAGAAGQGASCASGALGAGAGSILNSLMGPATELTPQQAEARRNTVSSLVAGIASSTGLSAAPASTAATLETTNNFAQVVAVAATAATVKCAIYEGCQRVVTHVADKTMYVAVQMKDALYVGSAALVGMVAASDTVGDWVSNFVGEVVSGTTLPGKPGEVVHVVTTPPLPAAQDRFGSEIPVLPAKPVGPIAVPGQENKGPATGMTTETPLVDQQGPGLIFSQGNEGAKGSVPSKTAVQELEVDAYKNLKAREVVGDGLEHDHIPSFAALRTAKEAELGRPLTELETNTLYQKSTAVEVPRDVHIAGPTYGGKNTPAQIQQDAADLCGAVCRDTEALRANLNSRGYDSKLVDETVQKIVERNRNTGVIK